MAAFLRKLGTYLRQLPLYFFGLLVPRSRTIWVFGAWFGHRYADNSRYVFEFVTEHEPQIRAIWLTREPAIVAELRRRGREVHLSESWPGFWLACRAGLAVATCGNADLNPMALSRTRRLQLWHGTPLKKIKADDQVTEHRARPV